MKKHILIISILTLMSYSCSNEDAPIDPTNLTQENQAKMIMFLKSDQFKDYLSTKSKQSNDQSKIAGKEGNNGIMVLASPYGFGVSSFNPQTGNFKYISGDDGSIEKLPNNRAKFSVHTNNPSAYDSSENLSSSCVDGPLGTFNFSVICDYTVEVYDFGEWGVFTFYNMTDENSSATSINGHCKISDAQEMIDWDTYESLGCSEATIYKTMTVKGSDLKGFHLIVE